MTGSCGQQARQVFSCPQEVEPGNVPLIKGKMNWNDALVLNPVQPKFSNIFINKGGEFPAMKKAFLLLAFIVAFAYAAECSGSVEMGLPAVSEGEEKNGEIVLVRMKLIPGEGNAYLGVIPPTDTNLQESVEAAVTAAEGLAGEKTECDVLVSILDDSEYVQGPSGGAAFALMSYSLFTGYPLRGLYEKTLSARAAGKNYFITPLQGVDEKLMLRNLEGIAIYEVQDLEEAADFFFWGITPEEKPLNLTVEPLPELAEYEAGTPEFRQVAEGIINREGDVAVVTRASFNLQDADEFGDCRRICIIGSCVTENAGIDRMIKNIVTNGHIRHLIICGEESRGHNVGDALLKLIKNGVKAQIKVIKDLAYFLDPAPREIVKSVVTSKGVDIERDKLIGITIRRFKDIHVNTYFRKQLSKILAKIYQMDHAVKFVFVPFSAGGYDNDIEYAGEIKESLLQRGIPLERIVIIETDDPRVIKGIICYYCRLIIGVRYHSCVFADACRGKKEAIRWLAMHDLQIFIRIAKKVKVFTDNQKFDLIISNHSFEHISDQLKTLSKISKICHSRIENTQW